MKVLFITGEFPPMQGGVGDYTREIGLALRNLGCEVEVVTSTQAGPVAGLGVYPLVERWNWGSWRILLDRIHDSQPDVVHIQYQAAAYAMHPAINFFPRWLRSTEGQRLRSVVTFHDLKVPYLFPKAGPLRRWVVNELARSSHAAITTNREDFEYLRTVLGEPPTLIPIGSNIQPQLPPDFDRDVWRARWGIGPDDLLLCFFGFINDRKGVDTLLDALNLLTAEANGGASPHLLFIGGQTGASDPTNVAYLAQIQAQINRLGLEQRVHWTGYVPDNEVSASFNAADLCVLPFRDGISFLHGTLHAALVHGAAIITTRPRVSLPELVDGSKVVLVPPQDAPALAQAIERLATDQDRRRTLSAGARQLSEMFRWESIAASTLELYRTTGSDR
ncbi:MAG: glycosyltransferase family 4 protein [Anaerolineae bacterium]